MSTFQTAECWNLIPKRCVCIHTMFVSECGVSAEPISIVHIMCVLFQPPFIWHCE